MTAEPVKAKGMIGKASIEILLEDMTGISAEVYIVPQFRDAHHIGGVAAAISKKGGRGGIEAFVAHVKRQPGHMVDAGTASPTLARGGNATYHIHVATAGTGVLGFTEDNTPIYDENSKEVEAENIKKAMRHALRLTKELEVQKVVAPALGTGAVGLLNNTESATVMMSAVAEHMRNGGKPMEIVFAVTDRQAFRDFEAVLQKQSLKSAEAAPATRLPADAKATVINTKFLGGIELNLN